MTLDGWLGSRIVPESHAVSRINLMAEVLLVCAVLIFCWALLNYVYNFSFAGFIGLWVQALIPACIIPLIALAVLKITKLLPQFRDSIFLILFLFMLVFLNYNSLLFGIDINTARPIIVAINAKPPSEQLEQFKMAIETAPNNRVLRVSYQVRLQQNSTQKEIAALLMRIEQPMFGLHFTPIEDMSDEEKQSYIKYLRDAKDTALSGDKEMKSILDNLRAQIVSINSTLGSSSVVSAYNSYILTQNDEQISNNISVFGPYFSSAAQFYSNRADWFEFILNHKHIKDSDGRNHFVDPSDEAKFGPINSQTLKSLFELMQETKTVNNTKGIYTNLLSLDDQKL